MKKFLLTLFGVLYVGLFTGGQAKAIEVDTGLHKEGVYSIEFISQSKDGTGNIASTVATTQIASGKEYVASTTGSLVYSGVNGIRVGSSTAAGNITFNMLAPGQVKPSSIVFKTAAFKSNQGTVRFSVSINGTEVATELKTQADLADITVPLTDVNELITSITISTTKSIYFKSMTVNYVTDKEANELSFPALSAEIEEGETTTPLALTNPKGLAVSFTSSNAAVATVDNSGVVTALKSGQTTITATTAGNADVAAGSVSYTLNVIAQNQDPANLSVKEDVVKTVYGQTLLYATANINNPNELTGINYSSSNVNVATINVATGHITIYGVGSTVITASFAGSDTHAPGSATYTLEVAKAPTSMSWVGGTTEMNLGDTFSAPTLQIEPASLASQVVYTAEGNLSYANGRVMLAAGVDGKGKVTATFESPYYEAAFATFEVNVTDPYAFEETIDISSFDNVGSGSSYATGIAANTETKVSFEALLINKKNDIQLGPSTYLWLNSNPLGLKISKITLTYDPANDARVRVIVMGSDKVEASRDEYTNEICNYIHELGETEYVIRPTGDLKSFYLRPSGALYLKSVTIQYQQLEPEYTFEKSEYLAYTDGQGWQSPRLHNVPEGLTLTYASSNAEVATVDAKGVVVIAGEEGNTTITASNAATKIYKAYSTSTEIKSETATQEPAELSFGDVTEVNAEYGKAFTAPEFKNPHNLDVTFTSSNTDVATVNAEGVVTIVGVGSATITATTAGNRDFRAEEISYVLIVAKGKVTLNWSKGDDLDVILGAEYEAPVLNVEPAEAASHVKFTSKGILSVVDGKVVLAAGLDGAGEVAASIESDVYEHVASAVYKIEVVDPDKVNDVLTVGDFSGAGTGSNYAIATATGSESGVGYSARVINNNDNFQMNSDGIWITNNNVGLSISKITLVFASNTANGRTVTLYGSDKVEANTTDYTNILANFTKTDTDQEFEYRATSGDIKSFYMGLSGAAYLEEVVVQYSKVIPTYTFAKDSYEVRMEDPSFVQPTVNNAPAGLDITYTSSNTQVAYFDEQGGLQRSGDGETIITASNEAQGIYNAYSTSYTLTVLPALKDELGDVNVDVNGEREVVAKTTEDAFVDVMVNDEVVISVLNATTSMTVTFNGQTYEGTISEKTATCTIPVAEQGEFEVVVVAKNDNFEETTKFTLVASYDEEKVLGTFSMNGDFIGDEVNEVVYIGRPIVFEIANAVDLFVDGTDIGEVTTYTYTPTAIGAVTLTLEAVDVYGQKATTIVNLEVVVPSEETLDFINNAYGMERLAYNKNNTVLTETSYTYKVNNQTRLLDGNNGLRMYNGGTMEISVPAGYKITGVALYNAAGNKIEDDALTTTVATDKQTATVAYTGNSASIAKVTVSVNSKFTPAGPEGLTPLYTEGDDSPVQIVYASGKWNITMQTASDEVVIYYKHYPTKRNAPRRVDNAGKYPGQDGFVLGEDGFDSAKADSEGKVNIPEISSPGVLLYYAHHPETNTTGYEGAVTLKANGSVTGIEEVEAEGEGAGEVYDLQGRRISKPTRGLYIQNGQKVLIRK